MNTMATETPKNVSPTQVEAELESRYKTDLYTVKQMYLDFGDDPEALQILAEEGLLPDKDTLEYWASNWKHFEDKDWARADDIELYLPKADVKELLQEEEVSEDLKDTILNQLLDNKQKL